MTQSNLPSFSNDSVINEILKEILEKLGNLEKQTSTSWLELAVIVSIFALLVTIITLLLTVIFSVNACIDNIFKDWDDPWDENGVW